MGEIIGISHAFVMLLILEKVLGGIVIARLQDLFNFCAVDWFEYELCGLLCWTGPMVASLETGNH